MTAPGDAREVARWETYGYDCGMRASHGGMYVMHADYVRDTDALRARAEKAEAEARRYEWLRGEWFVGRLPLKGMPRFGDVESAHDLDAAIDAAMQESK